MKFVIQNVLNASVSTEGKVIGKIDRGYVVFIGISDSDTTETADKMIKKMMGLRIFPDEDGKTNLSLSDVSGGLLLISQFTLYADCRKGNRPSFIHAGKPEHAKKLYAYIIDKCREYKNPIQTGEFGADMKVNLINDGPFTIILDSEEIL